MFVVFPRIDQGSKSYKEHHWMRKRKGEKGDFRSIVPKNHVKFHCDCIVPKNHVKFQELLKQNKSQDKEDNGTTIEDDDVECLGNTIILGENDQTAFCTKPMSNDVMIGQLTETNSTLELLHSTNAGSTLHVSSSTSTLATNTLSGLPGTFASTSMERGAQPKMVQSTLTSYLEVDEGQPPGPEPEIHSKELKMM